MNGGRLGLRARLFLASLLLLGVFGVAGGLWLDQGLRPLLNQRENRELVRIAALVAQQVADADLPADGIALDQLADTIGSVSDLRVTILDQKGRVIGDSDVDAPNLAGLPNHAARPEIAAVLADESGATSGWDRRISDTLNEELRYGAVSVEVGSEDGDPWRGVVRVARPTADGDALIHATRQLLFFGGGVGFLVALFMSALASRLVTRDLQQLLHDTSDIASETLASTQGESLYSGPVGEIALELDSTVRTLADERNRFGAVLLGLSEAVIALDARGNLSLVNPAGSRLLGVGRGQQGRPLSETVHVPELAAVADGAMRGREGSAEFNLRPSAEPYTPPDPAPGSRPTADGEGRPTRVVIAHATPQRGGGCVITLLDVTEMRRLETIRKDFVANVSHELRTPVSIIQASTEALVHGALEEPEYRDHFIEAIQRNSIRLGNLIDDLLRIARMEEGRMPIEPEPVDVEALVTEIAEVLGRRIDDRRHRLVIDIDSGITVLADAGALEQILVNLMDNARVYTPDRGTIQVRTAPVTDDPTQLRIEVADNGPGIEPHHRDRLFERFYRVDAGRAREVGGTGLGLAIVKHLAEAMGGSVGVDPNEPRGSVFWIRLPRVDPQASEATDAAKGAPASTEQG